jgi:hypothetical protein
LNNTDAVDAAGKSMDIGIRYSYTTMVGSMGLKEGPGDGTNEGSIDGAMEGT